MTTRGKVVSFQLSNGSEVLIDDEDSDLLELYWEPHYSGQNIYVRRRKQHQGIRKWQYLHRIILERLLDRPIKIGMQTDHIDRNSLNNCRSNLREVTPSVNSQNRRATRQNKSGIKGVTWHKRDKVWQAHVSHNGKTHYLGQFVSKELAYLAVSKKRRQLSLEQ